MKKYLLLIITSLLYIGCAQKNNIDITIPQNANSEMKEALYDYKLMKKDKEIEKIVPAEIYKADNLAKKLLSVKDDDRMSKHYAYLLKNQVEIAKLAKKRIQLASELNDIIIKRNDAIAEMKKEMQENDENSDDISSISVDETKIKNIFQFKDNSFTINGKYFDNDELIPNKNLKGLIAYLTNYLKENPDKSLVLESYTDGVGSSAYSVDLSLRRANRIKEMLVDNNIEENRVNIEPKGATDFIASNDTSEGRIQNNRIIVNIK